ncbi:DUF1152 domain-containing protein [Nakamurella multipartita]|uniref:Nudix hydrolase domain-containing protein n=1 Tax=Nakamurella multipartita (strain ATCC 700099 / DSM 44233 / CIP 104796 / JCM 9543 / NBRC 105858 / Y-104) TaxID=479431 RepID=C8X723_NAKMY|nr:DUF1152 domain-containing protein [Nakamurella multipartita]ACV76892.1 protein of unknown function DUF1152 [Nakamurella multipartita DSM 44233]
MERPLYVAAGGGGDALAATLLHRAYGPPGPATIATFSWDRLIVDPLPGPRSFSNFKGLETVGRLEHVVTPRTRPIPPAGSTLPPLARDLVGPLASTLVLLDPTDGAAGLREQLAASMQAIDADALVVVDVGGDVLATGKEAGLRSPLADALVLAAARGLSPDARVWVAGPGVDGELTADDVVSRAHSIGGVPLPPFPSDVAALALPILRWHPSEATALFVAAAQGVRGLVDIRSGGMPVQLGAVSSDVYECGVDSAFEVSPLADSVADSRTLLDAEQRAIEICGISEIRFEARKAGAARLRDGFPPDVLDEIRAYAAEALGQGVTYATFRRLAELIRIRDHASIQRNLGLNLPGAIESTLCNLAGLTSSGSAVCLPALPRPAAGRASMDDLPRHSVSVAGIIIDVEGRILVVKRRDNGEWQPPGGVLELDETIEEGLRREVHEETGIDVHIDRLTGVYKNMRLGVVALVFRCRPSAGSLQASSETEVARWMSAQEVESTLSPAFAIRVRDAIGEAAFVAIRYHDGTGDVP